jgi:hypothetical protein
LKATPLTPIAIVVVEVVAKPEGKAKESKNKTEDETIQAFTKATIP